MAPSPRTLGSNSHNNLSTEKGDTQNTSSVTGNDGPAMGQFTQTQGVDLAAFQAMFSAAMAAFGQSFASNLPVAMTAAVPGVGPIISLLRASTSTAHSAYADTGNSRPNQNKRKGFPQKHSAPCDISKEAVSEGRDDYDNGCSYKRYKADISSESDMEADSIETALMAEKATGSDEMEAKKQSNSDHELDHEFEDDEEMGPEINKRIAELVTARIFKPLSEEKYTQKRKFTSAPKILKPSERQR